MHLIRQYSTHVKGCARVISVEPCSTWVGGLEERTPNNADDAGGEFSVVNIIGAPLLQFEAFRNFPQTLNPGKFTGPDSDGPQASFQKRPRGGGGPQKSLPNASVAGGKRHGICEFDFACKVRFGVVRNGGPLMQGRRHVQAMPKTQLRTPNLDPYYNSIRHHFLE